MRRRLTWQRILAGATGLALAGAGWFFLAPQALGGPLAYVTIAGSSMEPRLHEGDLALVRRADAYGVGDAVAHESADLQRVVLHRIVRSEDGGYVLKGDANDWVDSTRPTEEEILGTLWLRIPWVGSGLEWLRTPRNAAFVAGLLVLLAGAGGYGVNRRRRRGQHQESRPPFTVPNAELVFALLATGAVGLAALAAFAFAQPEERPVEQAVPYELRGAFSYSAAVPAGPVYEDGRVESGEPVFLRLVPRAVVRFSAELESEAPRAVTGAGRLVAELSDESGWTRTVELQEPAAFEGDAFVATGTLRLDRIRALLADVGALTGVERSSYTLTLAPRVDFQGTVAGRALDESFSPRLVFRLDAQELRLEPGLAQRLHPVRSGAVSTVVREPHALSLLGLSFAVGPVRWAALALALLLLGAASALAFVHFQALRRDEPTRIRARYGSWLVPVAGASSRIGGAVVDLATMDGLVQLAERGDRLILHEEHEGVHLYLLEEEGVLYRYRAGGVEPEPLGWNARPPAVEDELPLADRLRGYGRPTED
jgi:signal peptidase I